MLLKNKDLNLILESFLRAVRHRGTAGFAPIAFVLTLEGKLAQFSGQQNHANVSASNAIRYLEKGIGTLVRERKCRAIGLPIDGTSSAQGVTTSGIFLEHQDSSAFQIQLPSDNPAKWYSTSDLAPVPVAPRFFLALKRQ